MSKFNLDWLKKALESTLTFGKKNAPALMTGGSIILGWTAVYIFWKDAKKAEKAIQHEEERRKEAGEKPLDKKEKFLLYLQYCWFSLALGLGSSGLAVWAREIDASRLAEMYLLTQFLEGKIDDKDKLIEKLKGEMPDKKFEELKEELLEEKFPEESIADDNVEETGKGPTLFIVDVGGIKFRSSITAVQEGILNFKDDLVERRNRHLKRLLGDAFYVSDGPFPNDFGDIYSDGDVDEFLKSIGVTQKTKLGDILELRYYGDKNFLSFSEIMDYKEYVDPVTGIPTVCFIKISDLLLPTHELIERTPI